MSEIVLLVCETCRHPEDPATTPADDAAPLPRSGEKLLAMARDHLADVPGVRVDSMRCLMACRRPCAVHLRGPGRMAYVLGDFPAEDSSVATLAEYIRHYHASSDGVVPFKDWPQGVKGRFIARIPPV
ncbi:DUF1636 domain-containing protein [Insolitispirillum peregrinum]|uniref:Predicted metal-binding protein n=1 Tax=Insolitispirillum peregrinum TaxID=80876 RepID=A0A1N7MXY3_9PROT|nr:DUF1636 domain-containing protein [Insolitispirillum peregrinum]SIS90955.1 Predicted metal-binding protein [Insolitispirillum peregrinum]